MSIETSHAPASARPSATESKHAKVKPSVTGDSAPATGGDFMSVLALMDTTALSDSSLVAAAEPLLAPDVALSLPSMMPSEDQPQLPKLSDMAQFVNGLSARDLTATRDTGELLGGVVAPPMDLTQALSETNLPASLATPAVPGPVLGFKSPVSAPLLTPAVVVSGLSATTSPELLSTTKPELVPVLVSRAPVDGAADPAFLPFIGRPVVAPGLVNTGVGSVGVEMGMGVVPAAVAAVKHITPLGALDSIDVSGGVLNELGALLSGKTSKLQRELASKQAMDSGASVPATAVDGQSEGRVSPATARLTDLVVAQSVQQLSATNAVALPRKEEQVRERSVFRSSVSEVNAVGPPLLTSGGGGAVQYTAGVPALTDVYIAEKVAYWISNDIQSAELKLDGIGAEPVEVSIRMHGNEAHVSFRTDELQARAALENASIHLKDLLQREGLVLSGVSVGTAGAGDTGGQERRPRQGMRQALVSSAIPALAERGPSPLRVTGNALDLFV